MINYKFILLVLAVLALQVGRVFFLSNTPAEAFASPGSRTGELIENLSSSNERSRINAALRLSGYDSSEVVRALIDAAGSDRSETVRRVALRSLGIIENAEALDVILSSFESSSAALRAQALSASVKFSSRTVSNAVAQRASDWYRKIPSRRYSGTFRLQSLPK
ncbi:MAG: HEAT repeat domain-containing protein, partial [Elusimicrobiota bacterium]